MEQPDFEVFKVWPTQGDRELFIDIVSSESRDALRKKYGDFWYKTKGRDQVVEYSTAPKLLGAYGYFYDRIRHSVETDDLHSDLEEVPDEAEEGSDLDNEIPRELKLDAIWQSLLEEFKIVEIVLEEGDDAQVIFETLSRLPKSLRTIAPSSAPCPADKLVVVIKHEEEIARAQPGQKFLKWE